MKTNSYHRWTSCAVSILMVGVMLAASADQAAPATKHGNEKTHTGTVVSVNPNERHLKVQGLFLKKEFNLGDNCTFAFVDQKSDNVNGLRPGQKVRVSYDNVRGVLVANRVQQTPLRYEGMVKAIDPQTKKITLHRRTTDKSFYLGSDCKVVLRDDSTGTLPDIKPGHWVTVTYETPDNNPTIRRIEQISATFAGTVTAIDLTERTMKAKSSFASKKFNLAKDCAIVLNGKTDGQMRDLRPGDALIFNYDEVNGINVVNRIARPETPKDPAMSALNP